MSLLDIFKRLPKKNIHPNLYVISYRHSEAKVVFVYVGIEYQLEQALENGLKTVYRKFRELSMSDWTIVSQTDIDLEKLLTTFESKQTPTKIEVAKGIAEPLLTEKSQLMLAIINGQDSSLFNIEKAKGTFTTEEIRYIEEKLAL